MAQHPTPLDEARAAVVLAQIGVRGTRLDATFYRNLRNELISRAVADRTLNLLAERGEIRTEPGRGCLNAVRVCEDEK